MRRPIPALVAALSLLAACGGDTDSADDAAADVAPTATTAAATTSEPATTPTSAAPSSTTSTAPLTASSTSTAPARPDLDAVEVTVTELAELAAPVDVVVGPDGDLYVAEKGGRVMRLAATEGGEGEPEELLDLAGRVSSGNEQGLLGLAFLDDRLYTSYTDTEGTSVLASWALAESGAPDPATEQTVLTVSQPFANHNGGDLVVGPDGLLYWALGDGGSAGDPEGNGQDPTTLLGSILRIRPTPGGPEAYEIPADNPFAGGDAGRDEVYVWGLRNPWRFSFDAATGDLWIGDVGQDRIEEVDRLPAGSAAGANLGWNAFEGTERYDGGGEPAGPVTGPVFEYGHDEGVSITGGYVYRGERIDGLAGAYVFADFAGGWVDAIAVADDGTVERRRLADDVGGVSSFGEGPDGELLITTLDGGLLRLDPA